MVRINGNFHFPQDGASNSKYVKPEDSNSSLFGTKPLENTDKGYTVESSGQPDGAKGAAKSNGANAGVSMTEVDALNNLLPEHRTSEDGREYTFLIKDGALAIKIADPYDANNSFTIKVRPPEKLTADKVVEYAHFQNLTCNDNGDPITINKDIKDVKKGDDGNVTITFKNGLTFTFPLSDDPNIKKPTDWAVNYPEINPPQVEEGSNLDKFYDFIDAIGLADKKGADCLITGAKQQV